MAVIKHNDCVSCGIGCINCGRNEDYYLLQCDECGIYADELYEYEDDQLCYRCLLDNFDKITEEDVNGTYDDYEDYEYEDYE